MEDLDTFLMIRYVMVDGRLVQAVSVVPTQASQAIPRLGLSEIITLALSG